MREKPLRLTAITAAGFVSIACGCKWFDTEQQVQELFDESDYTFIGQPIQALNPAEKLDKRFLGYDVLMKVQTLKKGRMTTDTVVILQQESNCARRFILRDTLVVFGSKVAQLQRVRPDSQQPDSGFADDGKTFLVNQPSRTFARYQKARARYPVVVTSQCISFNLRHLLVARFIRAKADVPFARR